VSARIPLIALAALSLSILPCAHGAEKQKLYRWVDDNGVVHYGDHVPPEYASRDREVLNEQGVAVGFEEGVVTKEEQAEKDRRAAAEETQRRAKSEAAQRDRVLLDTYLSVADIEDLRDRRMELLESQIKVTEQYLSNLRKRLVTLQKEAGAYKPYSDKPDAPPTPKNLSVELSQTFSSINSYEKTLARTRSEQQEVKAKFEHDIARFKELKGI
jgi:hypothetical protein